MNDTFLAAQPFDGKLVLRSQPGGSSQDIINVEGNRHLTPGNSVKRSPYARSINLKFRFTHIGISLPSYSLAVQLPLLKGQHVTKGRNTLQP